MADDLSSIWEPFDYVTEPKAQQLCNPQSSVLNPTQFNSAKDISYDNQIDNLKYLNQHPEIRALIRVLFREIVKEKPVNIEHFFRDFFKRPVDILESMIAEHIQDFPVLETSTPTIGSGPEFQPTIESAHTNIDTQRFTILYDSSPQEFYSSESLSRKYE